MIALFISAFIVCGLVAIAAALLLWLGVTGKGVIPTKNWKLEGPIGVLAKII
jgi:hypothetical protein